MYRDNLESMMTELKTINIFTKQNLSQLNFTYTPQAEFVRKYDLHCNFLTHMQVKMAIPRSVIHRAREKPIDKSISFSATKFQLTTDITMNWLKMKNRDLLASD